MCDKVEVVSAYSFSSCSCEESFFCIGVKSEELFSDDESDESVTEVFESLIALCADGSVCECLCIEVNVLGSYASEAVYIRIKFSVQSGELC